MTIRSYRRSPRRLRQFGCPKPAENPSVGLFFLMPTVLRIGGFSVRMYSPPREHGPPHVHVGHAGNEVVVLLGDSEHAPTIRETIGMSVADVSRALRIVAEHQALLLNLWRNFHG